MVLNPDSPESRDREDERHGAQFPSLQHASKLLISHPEPGVARVDTGQRATRASTLGAPSSTAFRALAAPNGVLPSVEGLPGVTVEALEAEHIVLRSDAPMPLDVSDQFLLLNAQQDIMVNRWDEFVCVREGRVEAVWPILAWGCHH